MWYGPTGCSDPQPCAVCVDSGTASVPHGLDVTIAGVVAGGGYGYYGGACCDRVNGTHKLRHFWSVFGSDWLDWCGMSFPGSACVWYGRIQNVPCDDSCPFRWMSIVLYNTDECDAGIAGHVSCVAAILLTREMPGPTVAPTFLAWTLCKMSISDQTCADVTACVQMAGATGLQSIGGTGSCGCSNLYPPYSWMYFDTLNGVASPSYWSCVWDYATGQLTLKTASCGCEPGYTPCCCDGSDESEEVRTVYATLSGVATSGDTCGCGCLNGWTWRLPLVWDPSGGCGADVILHCRSCTQGYVCDQDTWSGLEITLQPDRVSKSVTLWYGSAKFVGDWDGRCSTLNGLVLHYDSGAGDGCGYAGATFTLATSGTATESSASPFNGFCRECPQPRYMYVTLSGFGTQGTAPTIDLRWLNGTWVLEATEAPGCLADSCLTACSYWSVRVPAGIQWARDDFGEYTTTGSETLMVTLLRWTSDLTDHPAVVKFYAKIGLHVGGGLAYGLNLQSRTRISGVSGLNVTCFGNLASRAFVAWDPSAPYAWFCMYNPDDVDDRDLLELTYPDGHGGTGSSPLDVSGCQLAIEGE